VQSYRDLPLLLNQWANVVRWEMRPRLFLRTTEFLWQEGHTAHATAEDASQYAHRILHDVYGDFMDDVLALPVLRGRKTRRERFAGAVNTMTVEAMMGDGKALQMGTSHELGQNFAKAFDILYLDDASTQQHAWTTSWGVSTRMIGGLIMGHGDDAGIRVPPRIAPVQVVVLLARDEGDARAESSKLTDALRAAGVRVKLDDRVDTGFGRRAVNWELKGVPVRVEIGPRDLADGNLTVVRRDRNEKATVPLAGATAHITALLDDIQRELYDTALERRNANTADVTTIEEAVEAAATGFARIPYATLGEDGEDRLAAEKVTVRCLQRADGSVPDSDDEPGVIAYVARAY
jgi:prolyl-tRNA synthetase